MKNAVMKVNTTTKKVKYKGVQSFINATTGEVVDMHVTDIEDRDFNFGKIWMRNFIATLDLVGNQKTRLCLWVIEHLNRDNEIGMSYRQMADETGISLFTVRNTMKLLQDVDFLRKVGTVYRVNPDIYFKGTHAARMAVLQDYHAAPKKSLSADEKIKMIEGSIAELQKEKNKLIAERDSVVLDVQGQLELTSDGDIVERAVPAKKT